MPTYANPERDLLARLRAKLRPEQKDIGQFNLTHVKGKLDPRVAALRAQRSGNINPQAPGGPAAVGSIPEGVVPTKPMGVGTGRPVVPVSTTDTRDLGPRVSGPLQTSGIPMPQANRSALPGNSPGRRRVSVGDIEQIKRRLKQGKRVV